MHCVTLIVMHMAEGSLFKRVYHEQRSVHDQITPGLLEYIIHKLANDCRMNLSQDPAKFYHNCYIVVRTNYMKHWETNMTDLGRNPILRTYRYIKWSFKIEPYLYLVKDYRYRHAIAQLRTSSHILHIEGGRYTEPRTPVNERLDPLCNCVEDVLHFATAYTINRTERQIMYDKMCFKFPKFSQLNDAKK